MVAKRSTRGEPVIQDVLAATREELAQVGYRALRIEDVAARAGVHKTTIYRRWPAKIDLVHETLHTMFADTFPKPDTGSLRGDLLAVAQRMTEFMRGTGGQCLVRMMMTEGTEPDLQTIVGSLRAAKEDIPKQMMAAAAARGEVREDLDAELLIATLVGALQHLLFALCRPLEQPDLEALVDLLLLGAMPRTDSDEVASSPRLLGAKQAERRHRGTKKRA